MRDNPLIFAGHSVQRTKAHPAGSTHPPSTKISDDTEHKGNLLIRDLGKNGTDSAQNKHVKNTDAKPHLTKTPEKCLKEAERANKICT